MPPLSQAEIDQMVADILTDETSDHTAKVHLLTYIGLPPDLAEMTVANYETRAHEPLGDVPPAVLEQAHRLSNPKEAPPAGHNRERRG